MRNHIFMLILSSLLFGACSDQTPIEKVSATKNDLKRSVEKAVNRLDEKTCRESDLKCLAEKAQNRTKESVNYVEDKSKEAVDKLD